MLRMVELLAKLKRETQEIPAIGFSPRPTVEFLHNLGAQRKININACANVLKFPVGELCDQKKFNELTWVSVTLKFRCAICQLWRGLNAYQTHINYLLREKNFLQLSQTKFVTKFMYGY